MQSNQINTTTKRHPRTLNEAFPNTVEASTCIYKPCPYDIRKNYSFMMWLGVVFLSILCFIGLIFY